VDFGYEKEKVLTIPVQSKAESDIMVNEALKNAKVLLAGPTGNSLGLSSYLIPIKYDTAEYEVRHYGIGKNYFEIMGMNLVNGRYLELDKTSDIEGAVVVNKAFLEEIKMSDPLMKVIEVHEIRRHIVGVIENHVDNIFISSKAEPAVFYPSLPENYSMMLIRAEPGDLPEVKAYLEEVWKEHFPGKPFQGRYQEDVLLGNAAQVNENLKTIFICLTLLGGFLSAAGIFALASLNTEKRTKEIGIRKALGASVQNIVTLMNKEFVIILIMSGLLGSIGGFFITDQLLDAIYSFHVSVGIFPVILCALLIIVVGLSTTSATIFNSARANPVDSLRSE
jgi:ABC-type antimicrobial peptide transport system permease subunit